MILTTDQSRLLYTPVKGNDIFHAVTRKHRFFQFCPFIQQPTEIIKRNYMTEANLPLGGTTYQALTPTGPVLAFAGLPRIPFDVNVTNAEAQWAITMPGRAWVDPFNNDLFTQHGNRAMENMFANAVLLSRDILIDIIRRSAVVPANQVGGIAANLASFNNTLPALTQGYSAGVLAEQSVVAGGPVFQLPTPRTTLLDDLLAKIHPDTSGTFLIVPQRFLREYKQSWINRGDTVPNTILDAADFVIADQLRGTGDGITINSYSGVPLLVLSDADFAAAGHTVAGAPGAADYDIYAVKFAVASNQFDGCALAFMGDPNPDLNPTSPGITDEFVMGAGMSVVSTGLPVDPTGVAAGEIVLAKPRALIGRYQFVVGQPQAAAILTGVTD